MTGNILDFNEAKRQGETQARFTVDADDIRDRLHADPRAFVEWLYSGRALITRNEARIGDAQGNPGASLSIQLAGPDRGLWKDHATDEGGDLIGLYRASMGYAGTTNFVLSLKEIAKEFFGDPIEVEKSQWQPSAMDRIAAKKEKLGTRPHQDMVELGAPVATYKYYDTRGNIIAAVNRFEPDGTRASKTFRPYCFKTEGGVTKWVPGAPDLRPLYRLPDVALAQTVVLTEGEGCADALASLGIPATSAMQGAHAPIDKTDWSPLAGKTVIIWPDHDAPGAEYARNVAGRLTALNCEVRLITPPEAAPAKWDAADCVAEGGDAASLIKNSTPLDAPPRPRIRLLDIDQIESLAPPTWLIENILTENGLSMIWGRSGAMKSFVALDMALCVATGHPWHGHAVKQGLVIYLAAEGAHGLGRRAIGWRRSRGTDLPKPSFRLIPHGLALTSDDLNALCEALAELPSKPALVVIDTLARTIGAGDENKTPDMNAYVNAADRIRESTGANVLIIHHSGVHEEKRERGSNALRGAADTVIKVQRKNDQLDIINQAPEGKQKDAEEFKTVKLRTAKVAFQSKPNEPEQTTLILNLREDDGPAEPDGDAAPQRIGKNEQAIISAIKKAGTALGFTRLAGMTHMNKGSLTRALDSLVDKELLTVELDKMGNNRLWNVSENE
jgi:hypothetical protein